MTDVVSDTEALLLQECPNSKDGRGHCRCWWECEPCCWCDVPACDGTDCDTDTDMDGLPDYKENNDCCSPKDLCNFGTSATNPDSDGDGVPDGTEIANGTDPCDPADF